MTVLMTVYNGGRLLSAAVESILKQSFRDFEFLIVDDASTDGSLEVLRKCEAADDRVRVIENAKNKGQTACLNQGLREALGKWIARQAADDISSPDRLAAQWQAVRACPDLVLVGVNGWIIDEAGALTGMIHVPLVDSGIRWAMPWRNPFIHTGVMFRAGDGFYDEEFRICQDWEFWNRLAERGQMANLQSRLVAYRLVEKSLSHSAAERTESECGEIVARIWRARYGADPDRPELLAAFRNGLPPGLRAEFWSLYGEMRTRWSRGDMCQAAAVHRVQAAGALAGKDSKACLFELVSALREDPFWTLEAMVRRFTKRPDFRT
jgi:glycosyltransferase involved in cell wall biosynthesis